MPAVTPAPVMTTAAVTGVVSIAATCVGIAVVAFAIVARGR